MKNTMVVLQITEVVRAKMWN